jgi:hypothetical protein
MLEHLTEAQARSFLAEAHRVLGPGGTIRLAVPDLRPKAEEYVANGDADAFLASTLLGEDAKLLATRRGRLQVALLGAPGHKWMYDGRSLSALLARTGFREARVMPPGATRIPSPVGLDLHERCPESVFVEAVR